MPPDPDDTLRELFGDPIDVYTDAEALADGMLVDLSPFGLHFRGRLVNRITGGLWADLQPFAAGPRDLARTLRTKLRYAYYKGDIWQVPPGLWLIANEIGGWTLMRPEDY